MDANLYQHIDPTLVGNDMRMLVSDMAGRANIQLKGEELGYDLSDRDLAARITDLVKAREMEGYSYESADASFELLARRALGEVPDFFDVERFRVLVERRHNASGDLVTVSEAIVKVQIGDQVMLNAGEGNGPVHALDQALRKDLGIYQPHIENVELVDFKVRILTAGTDAVTRVLIESHDRKSGRRWFTVGVSPNIIDASFQALMDSVVYKLVKSGAPA